MNRATHTAYSTDDPSPQEIARVDHLANARHLLAVLSSRQDIRARALSLAKEAGETIATIDLDAAVPYLSRCLENASPEELENLLIDTAAGWWARGAIGAKNWRSRGKARQ